MSAANVARIGIYATVAALLLPGRAAGQQRAPKLEELLAAPFAADLVAGPSGLIAWVENVLGARNLYMAEPPAYRARQVTRHTADDGQRFVQLAFTPDGRAIAYVRGGNQRGNRAPGPPNPQMRPEGAREEVWIVATGGGEPIRVDEGIMPAVSPNGRLLVYVKEGQIWGAPLTTSATGIVAGEPRQLIRDRGQASSPRWSPTGNKLAFVSRREEHSFIGVYDGDARSLLFLDPSTDLDQEPAWSPDGARIAFIRVPSGQRQAGAGVRRTGYQWSIRVADARTSRGREVWRAEKGVGSAFWSFLGNERQLFWGAGDRIAFPWERTGWLHMYSVPASGGAATALTSGEFEVEHVALSTDGRELFLASNQDDIDRRHLWRVSIAAGPPRPVTAGQGIEYWPVPTSDGSALAFQSSGAKVPPRVEIVRMRDLSGGPARENARMVLLPNIAPKQFPARALVEPQQIIFPSTDGLRIHGQLFLPPDYRAGVRYPAVIYFHGGPNSQQVLGYNYIQVDYYQKHHAFNQYLAHRGFIVLSVNYRRGTGYGMAFREAEDSPGSDPRKQRDAIDVIGAGQYLRTRADVDPGRIGLWGGSAGGARVVLGLAFAAELFAAGFNLHGVATQVLGKTDAWRAPMLVVHGDDDRNVAFTQSVAVVAELRTRGVAPEVMVLPNEEHSFLIHDNWRRVFEVGAEFLERTVKNRAASGASLTGRTPAPPD